MHGASVRIGMTSDAGYGVRFEVVKISDAGVGVWNISGEISYVRVEVDKMPHDLLGVVTQCEMFTKFGCNNTNEMKKPGEKQLKSAFCKNRDTIVSKFLFL